ncbi:MAG: tRNA uracil 4-sulfurtransferase ThiI [Oligoflexales bacterium]
MHALLRYSGELSIKSERVKTRFQKKLAQNLQHMLKDLRLSGKVQRSRSRIDMFCDDLDSEQEALLAKHLSRVPGVVSWSKIEHVCSASMSEIIEVGTRYYKDLVKGRKFAVDCRRSSAVKFRSIDVNQQLGAALNADLDATVDLKNPEVKVHVEIRDDKALFYSHVYPGADGFPIGTGGRVVCLLSGGFDSAVAAYMVQNRGIEVDYVFCNLAGKSYQRSVLRIARHLAKEWSYGSQPRFHTVDFQKISDHIKSEVRPRYSQVILKRLLYRAAERIAEKVGAEAIVTGEVIAQVSSQTLTNLRAIEVDTSLPVLRPILTMVKNDIVALSRKLETFDMCAPIQEYCQLVPEKPATACSVEVAREEHEKLDVLMIDGIIDEAEEVKLSQVSDADLLAPFVLIENIEDKHVVLDIRAKREFERWHVEGSERYESRDLEVKFKQLDKTKDYIVLCEVGVESAVIAEMMQSAGYHCYSYKGGVARLKKDH